MLNASHDLKPCPFCDGYASLVTVIKQRVSTIAFISVQCVECNASTVEVLQHDNTDACGIAVRKWNTRVTDDHD